MTYCDLSDLNSLLVPNSTYYDWTCTSGEFNACIRTRPKSLFQHVYDKLSVDFKLVRSRRSNSTTRLECATDEIFIRPMTVWYGISLSSEPWVIGVTRQYYPKPAPFLVPVTKEKDLGVTAKVNPIEQIHTSGLHARNHCLLMFDCTHE